MQNQLLMLEIWIFSSGSNYLHPAMRGLYWHHCMIFSSTIKGGRMLDTHRTGHPATLSKCSLVVPEVRQKYLYKYSPLQVQPHTYLPEGTSHPFGVVFPGFSPISQSFTTAEESILSLPQATSFSLINAQSNVPVTALQSEQFSLTVALPSNP